MRLLERSVGEANCLAVVNISVVEIELDAVVRQDLSLDVTEAKTGPG